jgi:hypothetical protein
MNDQPELIVRLEALESEVYAIKDRNRRVELEKLWEQSLTRIVAIVSLTYLLMTIIFYLSGSSNVLFNAAIPTIGYFLSTQSVTALKKRWLSQRNPPIDKD